MKDKFKNKSTAGMIGAKITYDPRLDAYAGKAHATAKLTEANKFLADLDYDSLPEELKKHFGHKG